MSAGLIAVTFRPDLIGTSPRSLVALAAAGLLVGAGTRLGNGCTSGHGAYGIGRLAPCSIAATIVFMAAGILSVLSALRRRLRKSHRARAPHGSPAATVGPSACRLATL